MAMLVLVIGTVVGIIASLAVGQEPGTLLGFFIIVGSIGAVLGIRRGKSYLLFPVPALAFFVAAIAVGKVHDAKLGSSTASLGAGLTQWIAGIFFPAVVATILVVLIGGARWLLARQVVTGLNPGGPAPRGPRPAAPRSPRPAPRPRPPARSDDPAIDDWANDSPFEGQVFKTEMMPAVRPDQPLKPNRPAPGGDLGGNPRPARPPRDRDPRQRPDRDPWGDPRLPPDRSQPPGTAPRPRPNGSQPRNGAPRPSFNPNPNQPIPPNQPNQRPRRNPPDGWNQR